MKLRYVVLPVLASFVLGGVFLFLSENKPSLANSSQNRVIVYASVSAPYFPYVAGNESEVTAAVRICYFDVNGCTPEEVRAEIVTGKFLQENRFASPDEAINIHVRTRAAETAYAKAVSRLGSAGWEMISAPEKRFDRYVLNRAGSNNVERGNINELLDVYFRRSQ